MLSSVRPKALPSPCRKPQTYIHRSEARGGAPSSKIILPLVVCRPYPLSQTTDIYIEKRREGRGLKQSGGQNQKWPTCGQGGYITPAASGSPSASERGADSEVAHMWARWLHNPCRLWGALRFRAGDKISSGPLVGKVATQPLLPRGSPPPRGRGQNQKWPRSGQGGYITFFVLFSHF